MSPQPSRPAVLAGKIFSGRDAVRGGLLTKSGLRSTAWQHVFRGVYADSRLRITHLRRAVAAGWYMLPPSAAIAGRSAASVYGIPIARGPDPVEVVVPAAERFGPVTGLRIHVGDLSVDDVRIRSDVRVTSPLRTCWDVASWLDPAEAVAYLDAILSRLLVTRPELDAYCGDRAKDQGLA